MRRTAAAIVSALAVLAGCSGLSRIDPATYPVPKPDHLTFWGHACVYIDVGGVGIVTDPVFEKGLWQRKRFIGSPPDEAIARTRVVLLSHTHDDHTSPETLQRFSKDVVILCPEPTARFLAKEGIKARGLRPGESHEVDGIRFVAVAVHHPGPRRGVRAATDGRALGWVIVTPRSTIFYSGDTDYCASFSDVGWTYAPDIAVLNVNGHLMPPDAARAARDTRAPVVIPAHWGAYGYWVVGGNRHPRGDKDLERLIGDRLHVLQVGESFPIGGASTDP